MAELERNVLPMYMTFWKVYMDETIAYVKIDAFGHVLFILNSFHVKISLTYEQEINWKISFLEVLMFKSGDTFEITILRRSSGNDICLHWE